MTTNGTEQTCALTQLSAELHTNGNDAAAALVSAAVAALEQVHTARAEAVATAIARLVEGGQIFRALAKRYQDEDQRGGVSVRSAAIAELQAVAKRMFDAADELRHRERSEGR